MEEALECEAKSSAPSKEMRKRMGDLGLSDHCEGFPKVASAAYLQVPTIGKWVEGGTDRHLRFQRLIKAQNAKMIEVVICLSTKGCPC